MAGIDPAAHHMIARVAMTVWLGSWVFAVFWLAHKCVVWAVALWGMRWGVSGLLLIILSLFLVMLGLRLMWPVAMLVLGYETPRLARRDFRDNIANALFFIKTGGLWKEPF